MSSEVERLGPRPLPLHALAAWRAGVLAHLTASGFRGLGDPALERAVAKLRSDQGATEALADAVRRTTEARWRTFWQGVDAYRAHPFRRAQPDRGVVATVGGTTLFRAGDPAGGPPVIAVPSLVNGSEVLDLTPSRSLIEGLADAGFAAYLVDWGEPGENARALTFDAYVQKRLSLLLDAVVAETGKRPLLVGYCMGGLLATALAASRRADVAGLALLATPWDFHAPAPEAAAHVAGLAPAFEAAAAVNGALPFDVLQILFFLLDPTLAARKFRRFAAMGKTTARAKLFVAMEDWVNGGPDLAAPIVSTVLRDWYGANATRQGAWRVGDAIVTDKSYAGPTFVAAPSRDRIVPPTSALAYGRDARNVTHLSVEGGHVGMIVGDNAMARLWRPLCAWLKDHADD